MNNEKTYNIAKFMSLASGISAIILIIYAINMPNGVTYVERIFIIRMMETITSIVALYILIKEMIKTGEDIIRKDSKKSQQRNVEI